MSATFVIRNQLGHYWGGSGAGVPGARASLVACWAHRDEAVNTLFELGSKDTDLRGEVFEAESESAQPKNLVVSEHPVPAEPAESADDTDAALETTGADPH